MDEFLIFLRNNWFQFVSAGIIGFVAWFMQHTLKLYKKEYEEMQSENINKVAQPYVESFKKAVKKLEETDTTIINDLNIIKAGILNVYKKDFYTECKRLLAPDYIITFDDFNNINKEHDTYNNLGGNHRGDEFFKAVVNKYNAQTHN